MAKRNFSLIRKTGMLLESIILLFIIYLFSFFCSYKNIYPVTKKIGSLLFLFSPKKKKIIIENLKIIYPDKLFTIKEINNIGSIISAYELRIVLEMIAFSKMSFQELISYIRIDDFSAISQLISGRKKGMIGVTLHYGNWELLGCFMDQMGVPIASVVERQFNPFIDRYIQWLRKKLGICSIYNEISQMRPLLKCLKNGMTIALVADQTYWFNPLFIPFFGKEAAVPQGVAGLALHSRAQLIYGYTRYIQNGRYSMHFEDSLTFSPTGDKTYDTQVLMKQIYQNYENTIKQDVNNWFSLGTPRWELTQESLKEWEKNPDSSNF